MCGEMSGEPIFAVLLLGIELDKFSMSAPQIPKIKELIANVTFKDAQRIAREALKLLTAKEVEKYLQEELKNILGDNFYHILMI
ncbi:MAG: phosphoenolpyruvate--protein phosphotransferase, partial [Candidatus Omnitrophica bacterium]|nr:phosphoenolpyruvate--protein phosphotransferase [Candidatus Omnitrophota bacterium]